jgi:tetratricopeptide (TPR) repeat protein
MATLQTYLESAKSAILAGSYEQAVNICLHVLRYFPKQIDGHCLLAEAYRELGRLDEAEELFSRVLSADPENLVANWALSAIAEERGDLDAAVWQIRRAYDVNPWHAELRRELARLSGARPRVTAAGLARIYARQGLTMRAVEAFHTTLESEPQRLDARVALAEVYCAAGEREEAAKLCRAILDDSPDCLKANLILGHLCVEQPASGTAGGFGSQTNDDVSLSRQLLSRALALDPENVVATAFLPKLGLASLLPARSMPVPPMEGENEFLTLDGIADETAATETTVTAPVAEALAVGVSAPTAEAVAEEEAEEAFAVTVTPAAAVVREASAPRGGREAGLAASAPAAEKTAPPASVRPVQPTAPIARQTQGEIQIDSYLAPATAPASEAAERPASDQDDKDVAQLAAEYGDEWASLLTEDIQLDAESEERLEAALADAKAPQPGAGWQETSAAFGALSGEPASLTPSAASGAPLGLNDEPQPAQPVAETASGEPGGRSSLFALAGKELASPRAGAVFGAPVVEGNPDQLLLAALDHQETGQLDAAVEEYRAALRLAPERAEEISQRLTMLLAVTPDLPKAHRLLGDAYMKVGRFQLAIEEYNWVLSKGRDKRE